TFGFKLADRTIMLHLRKGNPEIIVSTHPDDSIAQFLVRHKLLTSEQLAQIQTASKQAGGDVIGALFALHLLSPNTAIEAVAQHAALLLSRAFASHTGPFTYESQQLANRATIPLGNRWGLMVDALRRNSAAELKRRLHAHLDQPMTKARVREMTSEFQLSPQEARALSHLDESRT